MSVSHPLLDIDDALVSGINPARADGILDYERCAKLHNYIAAYGWMAFHGREPHELDELLSRPRFSWDESGVPSDRLDQAVISFLDSIIVPDNGVFYWVDHVAVLPADQDFFIEDNDLDNKERFVILYGTHVDLGSHTIGLVYDQQCGRATMMLVQEYGEAVSPVKEHEDMWFPLETILTNWIHLIRIGKVIAGPEGEWGIPSFGHQLGAWTWQPYSPAQVDSAVAAMDRLSAAIEERMPPGSLLAWSREAPLLTSDDLDAASVPESCFIRSFLTRIKAPRFKTIAPGLEVPHDASAFAARQKFTTFPHNHEDGVVIPPVLIFACVDKIRTAGFSEDIQWKFLGTNRDIPFNKNDPIPTGLYSELTHRGHYDASEEGFRLLLPFSLRAGFRDEDGAMCSDGRRVERGSFTGLFQYGSYHAFGGEGRAQRLERLLDRWRELVETGVWTVGPNGVEGNINRFRDADRGAWRDYWIPPDW